MDVPYLYIIEYKPFRDNNSNKPWLYSGSCFTGNVEYLGSVSSKTVYEWTETLPLQKWWKIQTRQYPELFQKTIVSTHPNISSRDLRLLEMEWQTKENHKDDPRYFNASNSSFPTAGSFMKPDNPNYHTWKTNLSKSASGMVAALDGHIPVRVSQEEWLTGNYKGINSGIKRVHIKKDTQSKFVLESEVMLYISDGWQLGRIVSKPSVVVAVDRTWMTDGTNSKMILPEEIQTYLDLGWNYGRKFTRTKSAKVVYICPHCSKEGKRKYMNKYHFDNCRSKNASK